MYNMPPKEKRELAKGLWSSCTLGALIGLPLLLFQELSAIFKDANSYDVLDWAGFLILVWAFFSVLGIIKYLMDME